MEKNVHGKFWVEVDMRKDLQNRQKAALSY